MTKVSGSRVVFNIFNYFFLGMIALLCFYPFYYILIYSLSDPIEAGTGITFWIKSFSLNNAKKVFELNGILHAFVISVLRTVTGSFCTVMACSFLGYLFTKRNFPAKKFFYRMLVITMYVGGGLIPYYLTIQAYHLNNTFFVYIIPSMISAFNVILIKTFIEQMPASLEESASMDGAGHTLIFWKIILPLSGPILATITVFAAVGHWNTWMDNYLFVTDLDLQTLQYTLYLFLQEATELAKRLQSLNSSVISEMDAAEMLTPTSVKMTVTVVTILPIFLFYPFMQKYFTKGIMIGAIKG